MGGTLYLNNGQQASRSNVCVSGYEKGKPNFALSNFYSGDHGRGFTFNDPDLGYIQFPTSEHYLHFQKLSASAKRHQRQAWQSEPSPGNILSGIRQPGNRFYIPESDYNDMFKKQSGQFDPAKWDAHSPMVQMQINATKYQQSQQFRNSIQSSIAMGRAFGDGRGAATIIEDTATATREETRWGTGQDGRGSNVLGNTQTAFANMVDSMQHRGVNPQLGNPPALAHFQTHEVNALYRGATQQFSRGLQPNLVRVRGGKSTIDTAGLGAQRVQHINANQVQNKQASFHQVPRNQGGPVPFNQPLVGRDRSGRYLSVKPRARYPIDCQFDSKGRFVRAFWHNGIKWDEVKNGGFDRRWVKQAIQDAQQAVKQHLHPAQAAVSRYAAPKMVKSHAQYQGYKGAQPRSKPFFSQTVSNVVRVPDPKPIAMPGVIGVDARGNHKSFSINDVSCAYIDKGPKTEAVKLTFENEAALRVAFESLREIAPGRVRIDPPSNRTEGKPALSFHGSLDNFEKTVTHLQRVDQQRLGIGAHQAEEVVHSEERSNDDYNDSIAIRMNM